MTGSKRMGLPPVSWFPLCVWLVLAGCGGQTISTGSRKAMLDEIKRAESEFKVLLEAPSGVDWDEPEVASLVSGLMRGYADFANAYRKDSLAGVFLMRRADLLQGRGDAEEAEGQWLDVIDGFPSSQLAPEAMFRVGFLRETVMGDTTGAMEAYSQLVAIYPRSPWSEQAAASIKWLGFSESEFIRSLKEGS